MAKKKMEQEYEAREDEYLSRFMLYDGREGHEKFMFFFFANLYLLVL